MGNLLMISGLILLIVGLLVNLLPKSRLPLLPGDIFVQNGNFTFYFPLVTSILLSILLTIIINLFKK